MEYEEDLGKLEKNVERLLMSLDSAQDDRVKLKSDLVRLQQEKKDLEEEVQKLQEEKKLIHQRVSSLIGSIEKWEKSTEAESGKTQVAAVNSEEKGQHDPVQGMLLGN